MKTWQILFSVAVIGCIGISCGAADDGADSATPSMLESELRELDYELDLADRYVAVHRQKIVTIENMLHSRGVSLEQQYHIYEQLYNEYLAYQFDKAMQMLDRQVEIAKAMNDKGRETDANIRRASLYTGSGMFFEAGVLLDGGLDTAAMSHSQLLEYYDTRQKFHLEFGTYTQTPELNRIAYQKVRYYRNRILSETQPDCELHRATLLNNYIDDHNYAKADSLNSIILSQSNPEQRKYAMHAYNQARICEGTGRVEEQHLWFIRSAMTDIRCAVKDNASLCSLATLLLQDRQVDRAFRYITFSLNDALFYNAKLRPWQIASALPLIENAYHEALAGKEAATRRQLYIIFSFALVVLAIFGYVLQQYRRLQRMHREVERMNSQVEEYNKSLLDTNSRLEGLNNALAEANAVKDVYIGMFLSLCSDYIDKLSTWRRNLRRKLSVESIEELREELASQEVIKTELSNFYTMFDNAFLTLFPDFVEEFNGLLKPECRIVPKKGERLNTELRIFALIRLGITDSQSIALLLRYSINTIYNYRVRIRNNAAGNRDDFEERLKTIGSMKVSQ